MKLNAKSIRFTVFVAIIAVSFLSTLTVGLVWYFVELKQKEADLIEIGKVSLRPIITLAARNVEGGNLMNLRNAAAQDLYKNSGELLFIRIFGVSAGTPATEFADEIPPMAIEHDYVRDGYKKEPMLAALNGAFVGNIRESKIVIDRKNKLLLLHESLKVTHDGAVQAVFSAEALEGLGWKVFKRVLGVFVLVMAVAVPAALLVVRLVSRPILHVIRNITTISRSLDLSSRVQVEVENEIGELARWFNSFVERLEAILASVSELTQLSDYSVGEISASVEQQASTSTQQASSLTEITSTMETLSGSSGLIAEKAGSVLTTSSGALREAERGMKAVEAVKVKIEEIAEDNKGSIHEIMVLGKRSKEIGRIMEIINNIADQTKLIAFNAAIEAEGAGEAGKRFGVVAVEIRRLAASVVQSTGNIEKQIEEIQQAVSRLVIASEKGTRSVQEGTHLAGQAFSEFGRLVSGAQSANDLASQISESTLEQKAATSQMLDALREIERGIHQHSMAIHQINNVIGGLKRNSEGLRGFVGEFKVSPQARNNGQFK